MFVSARAKRFQDVVQSDSFVHIPVLLNETIEGLNIKPNGVYVDCTMGGAGHSSEILKRLNEKGLLIGIDQDDFAISRGTTVLSKISDNFKVVKANFINLKDVLKDLNIKKVDGIIYDLGVSSFQFDMKERGFSYNQDAPLDMRMDTDRYLTAYDIVNGYSENELKRVFYEYGEEKYASSIARNIVKEREKNPIETTFELVEVVKKSLPAFVKRASKHPAKKVFQALRIAVNDELNVLERSLKDALNLLNRNGRICVISFHSLEDRIVKVSFKNAVDVKVPKGVPLRESEIKREYKLITSKPIIPTSSEVEDNNRAHSAKLRIIEKI